MGAAHARFTLLVYADLECPFCQTYVPQLHAWALAQPDVALQWQHAPLSAHEPAAGDAARWAECVGERFGPQGFWAAVLWVYQHSRGSGQGLPTGLSHPEFDGAATGACLASQRPAATVREQAEQARAAGVLGTPTVRLVDTQTGRALSLTGPVHGDALASALDWLVTPASDGADELSAEVIGDMPR
ncbi:DsbA family protein [Delftia tsuruhatensis]|uniref:DsbA family protein n=1 Tax=Delftia tsuruhatensis TaxID=180282 RepID=UPI003D2EE7D5